MSTFEDIASPIQHNAAPPTLLRHSQGQSAPKQRLACGNTIDALLLDGHSSRHTPSPSPRGHARQFMSTDADTVTSPRAERVPGKRAPLAHSPAASPDVSRFFTFSPVALGDGSDDMVPSPLKGADRHQLQKQHATTQALADGDVLRTVIDLSTGMHEDGGAFHRIALHDESSAPDDDTFHAASPLLTPSSLSAPSPILLDDGTLQLQAQTLAENGREDVFRPHAQRKPQPGYTSAHRRATMHQAPKATVTLTNVLPMGVDEDQAIELTVDGDEDNDKSGCSHEEQLDTCMHAANAVELAGDDDQQPMHLRGGSFGEHGASSQEAHVASSRKRKASGRKRGYSRGRFSMSLLAFMGTRGHRRRPFASHDLSTSSTNSRGSSGRGSWRASTSEDAEESYPKAARHFTVGHVQGLEELIAAEHYRRETSAGGKKSRSKSLPTILRFFSRRRKSKAGSSSDSKRSRKKSRKYSDRRESVLPGAVASLPATTQRMATRKASSLRYVSDIGSHTDSSHSSTTRVSFQDLGTSDEDADAPRTAPLRMSMSMSASHASDPILPRRSQQGPRAATDTQQARRKKSSSFGGILLAPFQKKWKKHASRQSTASIESVDSAIQQRGFARWRAKSMDLGDSSFQRKSIASSGRASLASTVLSSSSSLVSSAERVVKAIPEETLAAPQGNANVSTLPAMNQSASPLQTHADVRRVSIAMQNQQIQQQQQQHIFLHSMGEGEFAGHRKASGISTASHMSSASVISSTFLQSDCSASMAQRTQRRRCRRESLAHSQRASFAVNEPHHFFGDAEVLDKPQVSSPPFSPSRSFLNVKPGDGVGNDAAFASVDNDCSPLVVPNNDDEAVSSLLVGLKGLAEGRRVSFPAQNAHEPEEQQHQPQQPQQQKTTSARPSTAPAPTRTAERSQAPEHGGAMRRLQLKVARLEKSITKLENENFYLKQKIKFSFLDDQRIATLQTENLSLRQRQQRLAVVLEEKDEVIDELLVRLERVGDRARDDAVGTLLAENRTQHLKAFTLGDDAFLFDEADDADADDDEADDDVDVDDEDEDDDGSIFCLAAPFSPRACKTLLDQPTISILDDDMVNCDEDIVEDPFDGDVEGDGDSFMDEWDLFGDDVVRGFTSDFLRSRSFATFPTMPKASTFGGDGIYRSPRKSMPAMMHRRMHTAPNTPLKSGRSLLSSAPRNHRCRRPSTSQPEETQGVRTVSRRARRAPARRRGLRRACNTAPLEPLDDESAVQACALRLASPKSQGHLATTSVQRRGSSFSNCSTLSTSTFDGDTIAFGGTTRSRGRSAVRGRQLEQGPAREPSRVLSGKR